MAILVGDVQVIKVSEKEYDGRKYYSCLGMSKDKEIYKFSTPYDDRPEIGNQYQMELSASDRDLKPFVKFVKVK